RPRPDADGAQRRLPDQARRRRGHAAAPAPRAPDRDLLPVDARSRPARRPAQGAPGHERPPGRRQAAGGRRHPPTPDPGLLGRTPMLRRRTVIRVAAGRLVVAPPPTPPVRRPLSPPPSPERRLAATADERTAVKP